ncbi:MAG: LptF/LptG family permease [Armatimonadota bacterium]
MSAQIGAAAGSGAHRFGRGVLDRAIFRELVPPFFFGMFAFLCILLGMETLYDLMRLLAREGFTMGEVGLIFACRLPKMLAFTFPMSILLAAVLGYNRLSGDGETTALRAGGVSFFRMELVGVTFAAVIGALTYWMSEAVVPRAERAAERTVLMGEYRRAVRDDVFFRMPAHGPLRRVVVAEEFDHPKGILRGVTIIELDEGHLSTAYWAEEAVWHEYSWELRNVRFIAGPFTGETATVKTIDPIEAAPSDILDRARRPGEMNREELRQEIAQQGDEIRALRSAGVRETEKRLRSAVRRWRNLAIQYHLRTAVPVSCIAFALVGIPLGIRPRRTGSSMNLGLAVVIVFGYYIFFNLLSLFGQRGVLPPFATAWMANAIALAVGVGLSIEAAK